MVEICSVDPADISSQSGPPVFLLPASSGSPAISWSNIPHSASEGSQSRCSHQASIKEDAPEGGEDSKSFSLPPPQSHPSSNPKSTSPNQPSPPPVPGPVTALPGGLEPIPAVIGREAGYTLDRSPVHHRATQRQTRQTSTHMRTLTPKDNFRDTS